MAWGSRILGVVLVGLSACGCQSSGMVSVGPAAGPMLASLDPEPTLVRAQLGDSSKSPGAAKSALTLPQVQPGLLPSGNPLLPTTPTLGIQQTAALIEGSEVRVKVRAWVNGRPIFDEELRQLIGPILQELSRLPEPQRSEKMGELINTALDHIIDQEVMYQDAIKKLEKNSPHAIVKLKEMVDQDFEKQIKRMRDAGVPEDQIKESSHIARRILERSMISTEYARNRIMEYVQGLVNLETIQEYYKEHASEFSTVDKVQWQDVFIATGPKNPTVADAKRFAEELLAKCHKSDDFAKLLGYDEGDSKFRNGEGFGAKRGEIRPPELEPMLFQMKDGQIGPVVELGTGVHIFRLVKREYAGQLPLNEKTQKSIRRKLENEIAEREVKQLVRELRARSVIRIVREGL